VLCSNCLFDLYLYLFIVHVLGADMFFAEDPFPYRNNTYDMEGLSDWHKASLPVAKVTHPFGCRETSLIWGSAYFIQMKITLSCPSISFPSLPDFCIFLQLPLLTTTLKLRLQQGRKNTECCFLHKQDRYTSPCAVYHMQKGDIGGGSSDNLISPPLPPPRRGKHFLCRFTLS